MIRFHYVFTFVLLFFCAYVQGQDAPGPMPNSLYNKEKRFMQKSYGGLIPGNYYDVGALRFNLPGTKESVISKSIMLTIKKLETDLGFFCKLDQSFDSKMKIPFRFRLGTLDYVNKYEGKNPYAIFPYNN